MSDRPLLFLDIDGVLNCIEGGHPAYRTQGGMPVWVPIGVTDRVSRLLEVFEPAWATAWLGSAHREWKPLLGLTDPFPWAFVAYGNLKLPEIIKRADGRPFVWIDDDADWELRELGWDRSMVDGLVLAPDPRTGLTDLHVEEALAFAAKVTVGKRRSVEL